MDQVNLLDRGLIAVFAKPPVPGVAKTRLAAVLGADLAAQLARAFLEDTWASAMTIEWARLVLATTEGKEDDFALPGRPEIWLQGEGDLGCRLERIARRALAESEFFIAIGADSPGLPRSMLEQARTLLSTHDAVIGPADDGGFTLLGLKRCPEGILAGLPWSASTTFAATRERLERNGFSIALLEAWFDVDVPEDLERLRSYLEEHPGLAPATQRLLGSAQA